jgi:outer membrane protein
MKKRSLIMLLCLFLGKTYAQSLLKLEEAQQIMLEKNWGLKVSEKQIEAAHNQVYKGNAGMAPIIDWNTSFASSFNQVNQNFIDGRKIDRFGRSISPNTNLAMVYTLYDGRRMQTVMQRLNTIEQQSKLQYQLLMQNTLSEVMLAYYEVQRLQQSGEYIKLIIRYYEERLKITEERWQIGRGSKLDFLQSKADQSTQIANLTNAENDLKTAKIKLNGILGREPNIDFTVVENINLDKIYDLESLKTSTKTKNQAFLLLKKSEEINLLNQKESTSFKSPRISLNSSFGYNFNKNNAGLISFNQSIGLNAGIAASWRIFDGNQINRNIQLSKINGDIIKLQKEDLINKIENELNVTYYQFETDKKLYKLELENKALAEENLTISAEKFKLGGSTILEINDAQTRFNTSLNRLVNAQYNLKTSELELLRLSGELLK